MAKRPVPWYKRLRRVLEEDNPYEDPDDFAKLILVLYEDTAGAADFIAQAAGFVEDEQKSYIPGWKTGAVMPTPAVRRAVVAAVRAHFAQAMKGP